MSKIHNDTDLSTLDMFDYVEVLIQAVNRDPSAIAKLSMLIASQTYTVVQKIPFMQLKNISMVLRLLKII